MKVLLINPGSRKTIYAGIPESFYKLRGAHPPLGLLYLSSYLLKKKPHYRINVYDINVEEDSPKATKKKIKDFAPDVVGVQAMSFSLLDALDVLKSAKEVNKKIITVIGGAHPSLYPKETVSFKNVDYCVLDEGEIPFYELLDGIEKKKENFSSIKGITHKKAGRILVSREKNIVEDIDEIPLIDRSLLPLGKYRSLFSGSEKSANIITSRGCPYRCSFCLNFKHPFRAHSPEYVIEDIKECLKLGAKEIFVVDDTFSLDMERAKEICRKIKKENLKFKWYINTRINAVDNELLFLFKKAGCRQINYGIESGSQKILDGVNKNINIDEAKKWIIKTKKAKIRTLCYFMIGLPGEKKDDLKLTMKFIREAAPDFVRFSVTTLDPKTEIYKEALKKGVLESDVWQEFAERPKIDFVAPVWTENFKKEELYNLLGKMSKSYYLSPKYIIKNIFNIENWINLRKNFSALIEILKLK